MQHWSFYLTGGIFITLILRCATLTTGSLTYIGSCTSGSLLTVGDICQANLTIVVPSGSTSSVYASISTNNGLMSIAQLCRPTITIGSNYNLTSPPIPSFNSSFATSQFDLMTIDFGYVKNSGSLSTAAANALTAIFKFVVIDSGQVTGSMLNLTLSLVFTGGSSSSRLTYQYKTTTPTINTFGVSSTTYTSSASVEIGKFNYFVVRLSIPSFRDSDVLLTANGPDTLNNSLSVCSIHIQTAGSCFECVESTKPFFSSTAAKLDNRVVLNLGHVLNTGINPNVANRIANSYMDVFVTYRVFDVAPVATMAQITLTVNAAYQANQQTLSHVHTVNIVNSTAVQMAWTAPTVTAITSSSSVAVYQSFNITMLVKLPQTFNNLVSISARPSQVASNLKPRVKLCSVVTTSSGENVPCPKCMNTGTLNGYSLNSSVSNIYDSFTWYMGSIMNFNLRNETDITGVNNLTMSIIGQVLSNPLNVAGSNVPISVTFTYGTQFLTLGPFNILIGGTAAFSNSTSSYPGIDINYADGLGQNRYNYDPVPFYFDIYTQPGSIYNPIDVHFTAPVTTFGVKLCRVEIVYVGMYSVCAQPHYVNNIDNGKYKFVQYYLRSQNDKIIVSLDALCNSANLGQTIDPIDGLIRFLVYFQILDVGTKSVTETLQIGGAFELASYRMFVAQLTVSPGWPQFNYGSSLYGFLDNSTSSSTVSGVSFATSNYVLKISPNTRFSYYISSVLTGNLANGSSVLCGIRLSNAGRNIPCVNPLVNKFIYSGNQSTKTQINTFELKFCSINDYSAVVNKKPTWDNDSVNLQILSRPDKYANGSYTVQLMFINTIDGSVTINDNIAIKASPNIAPDPTAPLALINSSANSATFDSPYNYDVYYFSTQHNPNVYFGQTNIIRYFFVLNQSSYLNLVVNVTTNLPPDSFEFQKLLIADLGDNFPCVSTNNIVTMKYGSKFAYEASINVGEVAYYPVDPWNITASTIVIEAFVRIPYYSNLTIGMPVNFTFTPIINNVVASNLIATTPPMIIQDKSTFSSYITNSQQVYATVGLMQMKIKDSTYLQFNINIALALNYLVLFSITCISNGRSFCNFESAGIGYVGKNLDGFVNEFSTGVMNPIFTRKSLYENFYNDTVIFDLGVVTNTLYTIKLGNNMPSDQIITFFVTFRIVDDLADEANISLPVTGAATINNNGNNNYFRSITQVNLTRTGFERSCLNLNVTLYNDTTTGALLSSSLLLVSFTISHFPNSTAEAYNLSVVFYLPAFVFVETVLNLTSGVTYSKQETAAYFNFERLHFGETISGTFTLNIDPIEQYYGFIQLFGANPPALIKIPYFASYNKLFRNIPFADTTTAFSTDFGELQYIPPFVVPEPVPEIPFLTQLISLNQPCRITSSVNGSVTSSLFDTNIGWVSDARPYYWLESESTYVQIAFGDMVSITIIKLSQLPKNPAYVPFTRFKISFSMDGVSYAFLPEGFTSTPLGASFNYTVPNKYFNCTFMRIHITGITTKSITPANLTGLSIAEIYGSPPYTYNVPISSICVVKTYSNFYKQRSYLYVPELTRIFVCDENVNRTSSRCFTSSEANAYDWIVMPDTVSTIIFWIRDTNAGLNTITDYLYGLAGDKLTYVRSDDNGASWKTICTSEFNAMKQNSLNARYLSYDSIDLSITSNASIDSWQIDYQGVWFNGANVLDWWN